MPRAATKKPAKNEAVVEVIDEGESLPVKSVDTAGATLQYNDDVYSALLAAQQEFPVIGKYQIAKGNKFDYAYADLTAIKTVIDPILHKHGIVVLQPVEADGNIQYIKTIVYHVASGSKIESRYAACSFLRPQDMGMSITYARRYAYCSLLGVVTDEDNDGQGIRQFGHAQTPNEPEIEHKNRDGGRVSRLAQQYIDMIEAAGNLASIEDFWNAFEKELPTADEKDDVRDVANRRWNEVKRAIRDDRDMDQRDERDRNEDRRDDRQDDRRSRNQTVSDEDRLDDGESNSHEENEITKVDPDAVLDTISTALEQCKTKEDVDKIEDEFEDQVKAFAADSDREIYDDMIDGTLMRIRDGK